MRSTMCFVLTISLATAAAARDEDEKPSAESDAIAAKVKISDFKTLLDSDLSIGTNQITDEEAPKGLAAKTIRGEVLTADGHVALNAKLILLRGRGYWNEMYRSNLAITDSTGKFVVRGAVEACHLAIEVGDAAWMMELTPAQTDVVVRLPKMLEVAVKLDRPIEMKEGKLYLEALDGADGQLVLMRRLVGTIDDSGAAKFHAPAGRYLATGSKRLTPDDSEPIWGWSALGEVTLDPNGKSEKVVRRFSGSRISGQINNLKELLKNTKADFAEVTVSVPIERNGEWDEFPVDTVLCDADGQFKAGPVPFGRAILRVTGVDRPSLERPFRQQPKLMHHRMTLERRLEVVELPLTEKEASLSARVAAILDSEQPLGVSWSHTDVQVASLVRIPEKEELSRELIRLMNDPQTSNNWQYVVIEALGRLRPVTAEIKAALLNGAKNPKLRRRASMLSTLGGMRADAVDLVDEFAKFKDDPDASIRGSAIRALGTVSKSLPEESPLITAALVTALDDPVVFIRKEAIGFLGTQKLKSAVPELRSHLRSDASGPVRAMCAWAIFQTADEVDEPVQVMIELLQSDDLNTRFEAAMYLGFFDDRAASAIPLLEANTKFEGKPPFSNSRDTRRYQLTSVAKQSIKKIENAGRGSPNPAPKRTDGLPKKDAGQNKVDNTNGDQRSNAAAGSGDPHRAQPDQEKAKASAVRENFAFVGNIDLNGDGQSDRVKLRQLVADEAGQPIADATVSFWPNQFWFHSGSNILGTGIDSLKVLRTEFQTGEAPKLHLENKRFETKTNALGIVLIKNLPVSDSDPTRATKHEFYVVHDKYEVPLRRQSAARRTESRRAQQCPVVCRSASRPEEIHSLSRSEYRSARRTV